MMSQDKETGQWFLNPEKVRYFVAPGSGGSSDTGSSNLSATAATSSSQLLQPYIERGTPRLKTKAPTAQDYLHQMEMAYRNQVDGNQWLQDRSQWTDMAMKTIESHKMKGMEEMRGSIYGKSKSLGRWGA